MCAYRVTPVYGIVAIKIYESYGYLCEFNYFPKKFLLTIISLIIIQENTAPVAIQKPQVIYSPKT